MFEEGKVASDEHKKGFKTLNVSRREKDTHSARGVIFKTKSGNVDLKVTQLDHP
jgi:hypothetical protein